MVEDPGRLERTNTVSAIFERQADAESALAGLRAAGVSDCNLAPEAGRLQLQVNAGAREGLVRQIIAQYGGRELDLPG